MDASAFQLPVQDPVLIFAIAMSLILVAPLLFARMRVPGIIGVIVAGVIVGPNGTGLLERSESIVLLGTVGLLYIMFIVGLDIDLDQFLKRKHRSLVFGALTFTIPQVAGTAIFLALGFDWPAAILIASMFASHTLVAYPVARRLGIARDPAVTTAVGGTILTDTAALLVLAVVARSTQGDLTTDFWTSLTIFFLAYVAAVVALVPLIARWFFCKIQDGGGADFAFVLAVVFFCSWGARAIGIEPIIGAFLAGLALNRLIPRTGQLMGRIQFFGDAFIIPFFLLYIGMLVDLSVLVGSVTAWVVMGTMLATNVASKWVASMVTSRIFAYSRAQGWVIFGLSTCEGAATLAATLVGYDLGIIGDEVLNGVIMMILVTCIVGPWVVAHFGREVVRERSERPLTREDMPQRVLVPLANPATADPLMDIALMIRGSEHVPVYPMTVVPVGSAAAVAESEAMMAHAVEHGVAAAAPVHPVTRIDADVAKGIARAVQEKRISDVVIGWNGELAVESRVFGSVLDRLLDETSQQVMVVKLNAPLSTLTRLVLVVPPHAEEEVDFEEVVRRIKTLAAVAGTDLFVLMTAGHREGVEGAVERVRPRCRTTVHELRGWEDLDRTLRILLTEDDLLVLLGKRPGHSDRDLEVQGLPRSVALAFPEANLLALYGARLDADPAMEVLQSVASWADADHG